MTKKTLALTMSLLLATSSFSPITFAERTNGPQEQKLQQRNNQGNNQNSGERGSARGADSKQRMLPNANRNSDNGKRAEKQTSREHRNGANFRERDQFAWKGSNFRKGHPAPKRFRGDDYRVNDWHARGLREPPAGQHWAYINGNYVLIAAATGIITAILLNGALN
ncbi:MULTISPECIES: RcnB family protein [Brenneria]|uniref:RcnB family protein n=1 Tax=Brenneria nigrifluens DSM 30175 = ATCC 13028 TaxID=1121120 RepID=A0A2U1USZ2_9GAMM|nr:MULTISPECIES: RcnB family protein [Brenneria]EHD21677.1 uncharacterized protein YohN precursor [Brenneria sp. EniD312]PWC24785.1 hypothetical protein DDT54_07570 [Brenneria nigrifluens DSM 30175 = ATCC 13028]QCR04792.1 hypothetical protein EH206_11760 [Brenneria nigrifluens DSM 30175 = ATCC 13028]